MFGKSRRRKALVLELVEHRMRLLGFDNRQIRLELKQLSGLKLAALPESTIVSVVHSAVFNQKRSILLQYTLSRLESHRKLAGHNEDLFKKILRQASGPDPTKALVSYSLYRIKLESTAGPLFNLDLVAELTSIALDEVIRW